MHSRTRILAVAVGATALTCISPATGHAATDTSAGKASTRTPASAHHARAHHATMSRTMSRDLAKLRHCESGGNWRADTGNGYYGAYQFAVSTWHGLGFGGLPDEATPSTQNAATLKLHAMQGWHPWPSCARQEGL